MPSNAVEVFISYAHEDEGLREELDKHLKSLEREELIKTWHDREMTAGVEWENTIDEHLESAHIILLLISADFINSDYCFDIEMKRALERHDAKEARVIPVILRACSWQKLPFGRLNALPKNGTPIPAEQGKDEAFTEISEGIRQAIYEMKGSSDVENSSTQSLSADVSRKRDDSTPKNILFLLVNPPNANENIREMEISRINNAIDNATFERFKQGKNQRLYNPPVNRSSTTKSSISQLLTAVEPYIVNISGTEHGIANLVVEDPENSKVENLDNLIAELFRINAPGMHCAVLNGCYSENQAREIVRYVDFLIGISQSLSEELAIIYLDEFYFRVGLGRAIANAHEAGCHRLLLLELEKDKIPVLLNKKEEKLRRVLEKKLKNVNKEIEKRPEDAHLWKQKGIFLHKLNFSEDADIAYEKAASLEPKNSKIREEQGDALEQSGDHGKAASVYDKALELLQKEDYKVLWKKGKSQARAGQYDRAIASYKKALMFSPLAPDDYLIYREYGCILESTGRYGESISMYKRALQSQPRCRAASYERKWLYQKIYSMKSR